MGGPTPEQVEKSERLFHEQKARWVCPRCGAKHLGDPSCPKK